MTLPWFKCYPRDFREGMTGLTCEERGAYSTLLLLIYERGAPIPDEDSWIAAQLWISVRAWKKVRASLVLKGKLFALNFNGSDHLMNKRAADELSKTAGICTARSEAGKAGGKQSAAKRTPKANDNNGFGEANASSLVKQTSSNGQADIQTIRIDSVSPPNGEDTGGEPPNPDQEAWQEGPIVLVAQGGMKHPAAKAFFGGLLKTYGLEPRELLPAIGDCKATGTRDPQALMSGYAKARSRKRQATGPPKRVGFV